MDVQVNTPRGKTDPSQIKAPKEKVDLGPVLEELVATVESVEEDLEREAAKGEDTSNEREKNSAEYEPGSEEPANPQDQ